MHWLQWRYCNWLPKTCKATIWPSVFSTGLKYATEGKQFRLEKSLDKAYKTWEYVFKKKNKKELSGCELKRIWHFNKQIVITNITEQRKRKLKHTERDNQVRNKLIGCKSNWLNIFRKQDTPPRAANPYLDPHTPAASDLRISKKCPSFFLTFADPFSCACPQQPVKRVLHNLRFA